jgi:poly(hydroxyalkanoate) depolymerase family esterase
LAVGGAVGVAVATLIVVALIGRSGSPGPGQLIRGSLSERGDLYHYAVYVPSSRRPGAATALVVVLHGCNETPEEIAAASGYDAVADRGRFIVLYPDVDASDAGVGGCWKGIWEPAAEGRGRGDAGAIAAMTEAVAARWHVDRRRLYAIGISAGGFETAILGAVYPDLFAAIGIHSGTAYMGGAQGCLATGELPTGTDSRARAALAAMGARARLMPVIVFHGDADSTVPYACGRQAASQWLRTDDLVLARTHRAPLSLAPGGVRHAVVPGGHAYTVTSYSSARGCVVVALWTVHGMGHYWSGGSSDPAWARYSDPRGPSAARASWAFFSGWNRSSAVRPCACGCALPGARPR